MRLQKYLAEAGVASRRKCEEIINEGRVKVNGITASLGSSVSPLDTVELDGKRIEPVCDRVVFAFYKPKNVICSSSEDEDRVKVIDYFKDVPLRLYTVGRLDYDSEGLIFVTNDGGFADKLTHPRYEKTKTYRVLVTGSISEQDVRALSEGISLEDGPTAPAEVSVRRNTDEKSELFLTIHEGRNRQVRRMLGALGHKTLRLTRVSIGGVKLGNMKPGERRQLSKEEIDGLLQTPDQTEL